MKKIIAFFTAVLCASLSFAQLTEPSGLTVFKDWNFDGDGAVGGTVDSGSSATDWVSNSWESVSSNGFEVTISNPNETDDNYLYVDTTGDGIFAVGNDTNVAVTASLPFSDDSSAYFEKGFVEFRAKNVVVSNGLIRLAYLAFDDAVGIPLFTAFFRQGSQFRIYDGDPASGGTTITTINSPSLQSNNTYQISWNTNGVVEFYFDAESGGSPVSVSFTNSLGTQVARIRHYAKNDSADIGRVEYDSMTIKLGDVVVPPPPGSALIAHYSFDGATLGADSSTNSLDTDTVVGTATQNTIDAKFGAGSLSLGESSVIAVDNGFPNSQLANFTASAWVKVAETNSTTRCILSNRQSSNTGGFYLFIGDNSQLSSALYDASFNVLNSGAFLSPNTWAHVAVSYDGTTQSIYVNGALANTNAVGYSVSGLDDLTIGGRRPTNPTDFLGNATTTPGALVDDVGIWNYALSASEILSVYNSGVVSVVPAADNYAGWVSGYDWTGNESETNLFDNPDMDSMDNLLEYALGGSPVVPDDATYAPTSGLAEVDGSNYFEYVYRRRLDAVARGLTYEVQNDDNLVFAPAWTNEFTEVSAMPIDSDFESVLNRISTDGQTTEFGRLNVELSE